MDPELDKRPDARAARLAATQWSVLSLAELRKCGLSATAVRGRVRRGWLHPVHRGVYGVGQPPLSQEGRWLAAVKACGRQAVLSHYAAAALWGFVRWDDRRPEVTVPGTSFRARPGVTVHRAIVLHRRDTTRERGIPVTTPARTLVDLAGIVSPRQLRRALREAYGPGRVKPRQVAETMERLGPRRGTPALRRLLANGPAPTRSELEDAFLALVDRGRLSRPDVNVPVRLAGRTVIPDFRWPAQRLVVEADGAAWHDHKLAREDDAERQALLEANGERVLRVTWHQVMHRRAETLSRLRRAGAPTAATA